MDSILMLFMRFLRDENRKPGVLSEHEMKEVVSEFLAKRGITVTTMKTQDLATETLIRKIEP